MKPYPLASLNHFTFPLAIAAASYEVNRSCTAWCRASPVDLRALYRPGYCFCQVVCSMRVRFALRIPVIAAARAASVYPAIARVMRGRSSCDAAHQCVIVGLTARRQTPVSKTSTINKRETYVITLITPHLRDGSLGGF